MKYRLSTAAFARSRSADTGGATSGASVTSRIRRWASIAVRIGPGPASSPFSEPTATGSLTSAMSRSPAKSPGETWAVSRRSDGRKTTASPARFSFRTSPATASTSSTRLAGDRSASDRGSSATTASAVAAGTVHAEARGNRGCADRAAALRAVPISRARPSMLNRM
ncbi:hypothetical protein GCM10010521_28510 [Streptomyces rameus]|uniref:Uncharacterized protein n=1 Tax=Streptomyces rameus TaxID=68261 RepID=A0ABP6NB91_9ACTN